MSRVPPWRGPGLGHFLTVVGPMLRREMLKVYNLDSCIAASRIGMDFLAGLGIPSEAVRVEALFFSAAMIARFNREGRLPNSTEERERWVSETGGHSVGLGVPMPDKPGLHVVLLVDGRFLWDLSVDQADRPLQGLVIDAPIVFPVDARAFKKGEPQRGKNNDGAVAVYKIARDRDDTWRQSNNWRRDGADAPQRASLVEALLRGVADAALPNPRPTPT